MPLPQRFGQAGYEMAILVPFRGYLVVQGVYALNGPTRTGFRFRNKSEHPGITNDIPVKPDGVGSISERLRETQFDGLPVVGDNQFVAVSLALQFCGVPIIDQGLPKLAQFSLVSHVETGWTVRTAVEHWEFLFLD